MITVYNRKAKQIVLWLFLAALVMGAGCKKGTFDINAPNPNALSPDVVPPKYYMPAALSATSNIMYTGGNGFTYMGDLFNTWMGYWSASGGYTPSPIVVLYQLNSGVGNGNWDDAYFNLKNYQTMIDLSVANPNFGNYQGIAMIMKSFGFQRIVDLYNNAPYSEALSSDHFTPAYDNGADIYDSIVQNLDNAIAVIHTTQANLTAEAPGKYDVMFQGNMTKWIQFANTLKLKILMNLTATSSGPAFIKSELAKVGSEGYITANASVNPGYSTAANNQENPFYLDVAFTIAGSPGTNAVYWRANSYGIGFYQAHSDPRLGAFYQPNKAGNFQGRKIGSVASAEGNDIISGVNGPGTAKSPAQSSIIIGAFESYFLQAEAVQRGYITGDDAALYKSAVEASFVTLGLTASAADTYMAQADQTTNYVTSTNKLKTLLTQAWAAYNSFDPLASFDNWRRTGFPSDLPVSDYPGSQAAHIPYRLPYPTSETSYNSANVGKQGSVDYLSSKIFWQP